MNLLKVIACACFAIMVLGLLQTGIDSLRSYVFPPDDAYFESYLNQKFPSHVRMAGRTLECSTRTKTDYGYFVDCQFFKDGVGEEHTSQWFAPDGSYISSLDGG